VQGMTWADVKFVKDATVALMECRNILKHTYIYGYYLPEKVNRDIFEHLQSDLESGVEVCRRELMNAVFE
jgi:ariadne-1